MKRILVVIVVLLVIAPGAWAQTNAVELDLEGTMDAVQQFAEENLDDDVLAAFQGVDRDRVRDFLRQCQDYLQGDSVVDVAQLKNAAPLVLPLLDAHDETQPYAAWLRSRLDYFDAAAELATNAPPPKPPAGSTNAVPIVQNPTYAVEQQLWIKKVAPRPWPGPAKKYVPQLKAIFAAEHVPAELVWLAEVESGFDARARSPVGALGMFQLMPETARSLGLRRWPIDQRKQVETSARAAARYLRYLHGKFGDWRLAVAAYNCGEGTVQRMLKRHGATRYEQIATRLPAETQMYVPKVEATILKREGVRLTSLKQA
jgi:membrane-bound lytic murein transglycosylase D